MLKEPIIKTGDGYATRKHIIEGDKELQETLLYLPDTRNLPTTHEIFVEHAKEERNKQILRTVTIGVRRKASAPVQAPQTAEASILPVEDAAPATPPAPAPTSEPDNLNDLDDAALELEAAKASITVNVAWRRKNKAERVRAIRDARAKQG